MGFVQGQLRLSGPNDFAFDLSSGQTRVHRSPSPCVIFALRVRDPSVVHIDAARLHEPPGFALRRRKTNPGDQIDDADPVESISVAGGQLREHPRRWKEHLQPEFRDEFGEQQLRRPLGPQSLLLSMHKFRHLLRQGPLPIPRILISREFTDDLIDLWRDR